MGPSLLIHVQHLLGIGHFVRARHLAAALAAAGFDVHLVSGGVPVPGALPIGVRFVQLPPIRVADASFAPLLDDALRPIDDAFRERRRDRLLATFDAVAPSLVLIETFPFGRRALRFELLPLLERIATQHPRPKLVSSVRDILQRQAKPEREREMLTLAGRWFDAVLVHGDARLARFEDSFSDAAPLDLAPPVHYTGFVGVPALSDPRPRERNEVVVSAGGGAVGEKLLATALAAQSHSALAQLTWRVLAGPNLPAAVFERLRRDAGSRAIVEHSRGELVDVLRRAVVSISQAGYNTALDVIASGARAVLVPFAEEGQTEQAMRAERLAAHDLAIVVHERELTPESLARAVDSAATRTRWGRWDFASDGARRTAELIARLTDDKTPLPASAAGPPQGARPPTGERREATQGGPHTSHWTELEQELDAWHATGKRATLWCRDDDATRDTPALRRLLDLAHVHSVPIALAAIPAAVEPGLVERVRDASNVTVLQHGYAHRNHAVAPERSCELGVHRGLAALLAELAAGCETLRRAFGRRFLAVVVPPWNRIHDEVVNALPQAGYHGLSAFGPRLTRFPAPGLMQCNTHVDLIAWRKGRGFIGASRAVALAIEHLAARRQSRVDADEATGLLTHHLDLDEDAWGFLGELLARTRAHRAVEWLSAERVFGQRG